MIYSTTLPPLFGSGICKVREPIRILRLDCRQQQILLEMSDPEVRYKQAANAVNFLDTAISGTTPVASLATLLHRRRRLLPRKRLCELPAASLGGRTVAVALMATK